LDKKLDYIESKINDIEQEIFKENEKAMVSEISNLGRRVISFRHTISSYELVLDQLKPAYITAFGKASANHIATLPNSYDHLMRRVQAIQRTLDEFRDTNTALLTTKQNEIMKILTIMAFITFPLTLFTSMFGMNTVTTPILGQENDFWIITGIMIVVSIGFFGYFKFKDWI
ncbi:magnesium transporter CorA family protein, partial [Candidatus Kaiserbacteria bacterium]|nr:magnesium transporter CorA family protein [Candidatus Kaiserbacteria bacterium]